METGTDKNNSIFGQTKSKQTAGSMAARRENKTQQHMRATNKSATSSWTES